MLSELSLTQFRNHADATFVLGKQTIILGANGAGKTNILEAIAMLSLTTSWRTDKDSEVITWEAPFTRIVSGERELVIQRKPYYKRIRVDGVSKRAGEVIGSLPTVLFQPDDSQLVTGTPAYRRTTLDRLLSQGVPGYMSALSKLQRILRQRNQLLKRVQEGVAAPNELDYWDEHLAQETQVIRQAREAAIPVFNQAVQKHFAELVPELDSVEIVYQTSPRHLSDISQLQGYLQENRGKEVAAGVTLYGPQREDLLLSAGGHPAAEGMSRGQIRALVLAWKLAEIEYLEHVLAQEPILLLDDVFSEFDAARRERVVHITRRYQSILTATEVENELRKGATIITL